MDTAVIDSHQFLLTLIACGVFAGILSGFLGLGGMSVYVPLLIWTLHTGLPDHTQLISAVLLNSFSVVVIVGLASWFSHHSHGTIRYRKVPVLSSGAALGTIFGYSMAIVTGLFASMDLLFGFYLIAIGLFSLLQNVESATHPPSRRGILGIGLAGGTVGGFVGFNGNSVFIPLLRNNGLNVKESMATGQLIGLTVSALMVSLIGLTFGFQNFRGDICSALAIGGFGGSYFGARLKRAFSFRHMNLALVASCWTSGGLLLLRLGH
jgi:uncharacterized membrane protein YfcA